MEKCMIPPKDILIMLWTLSERRMTTLYNHISQNLDLLPITTKCRKKRHCMKCLSDSTINWHPILLSYPTPPLPPPKKKHFQNLFCLFYDSMVKYSSKLKGYKDPVIHEPLLQVVHDGILLDFGEENHVLYSRLFWTTLPRWLKIKQNIHFIMLTNKLYTQIFYVGFISYQWFFKKNCMWMYLPDFENWLSLYLFLSPVTTHRYTNLVKNTQFCSN